jgi:alkylation response protein AidB-like acyl-CoA dehydrogenase
VTRTTFGKTLISHQAIRSKFSMLAALIHPAHAFMESIVAMIQTSDRSAGNGRSPDADLGGLIALLKVQAGRTLEQAVRESQQVMGGLGYARTGKGARIEQISRDVRVMVVGGGSEEILTELAFTQERRDLEGLSKATLSKL